MIQLSVVKFKKGSYIIVEGAPSSERFFIIQSGNVNCYKSGENVRNFGPGGEVGIISCMTGCSDIETCVAATDVSAVAVKRNQYIELIKSNASIAPKIINALANRIRTMNDELSNLTLSDVTNNTPDHIFEIADYYDKAESFDIAAFAYYQYLKALPSGEKAEEAKQRFGELKSKVHCSHYELTNDIIQVYEKDTMVFSESQTGSDMFIIQSGQIKISKIVNSEELTLAMLQKGDIFGEMEMFENKPRAASAIACTDCTLVVVNSKNFEHMIAAQPQFAVHLTALLSEHVWSMYRKFDNAKLSEPLHKLIDRLAIYLEKRAGAIKPNMQFQTDITTEDLANMCGIPKSIQKQALERFKSDSYIQIIHEKIFVLDCLEIIKRASFYRKCAVKGKEIQ